jgi:hypothetical protein
VPALARHRCGKRRGSVLLLAWVLHGSALLAWAMLETTPRFGFAPALSVTAWLVLTVYAIESQLFPAAAGALGAGRLGSGGRAAGPGVSGRALPPSASAWLPLHWRWASRPMACWRPRWCMPGLMTRAERQHPPGRRPDSGMPLLTLERLTFRFVTPVLCC